MIKILVTGAAGRIGGPICQHLQASGFEVRAVDRAPNLSLPVRVEVVNLLDREACYRVIEGLDAVVHLANHSSYQSAQLPQTVFNENVAMNMNVFQAACDRGVKRILFSSSVQAFTVRHGPTPPELLPGPSFPYLPLDGKIPARSSNPYGLSKQVSEDMLRYFVSVYGVTAVAIRFPYVIDEETLRRIRERKGGHRFSAEEAFAYLYIEDAARLVEACLKADLKGYHPYFPAAQDVQVAADLPALLARHFNGTPWREGAPQNVLIDISDITRETGWRPSVNSLFPGA